MGNIGWSTLPDHQNAGDFGHKTWKTYFGVQIHVTDRSGRCPECILRTVRLKTKFITFFKFCIDILSKRVQQILCILRSRRIRLWNVRVFETSTFETILQTSTSLHFTSFQWIYMIIFLNERYGGPPFPQIGLGCPNMRNYFQTQRSLKILA